MDLSPLKMEKCRNRKAYCTAPLATPSPPLGDGSSDPPKVHCAR